MPAVVVDDQVVRFERGDAAHRRSFHADGKVHRAVDQTPDVEFLSLFLKVAGLAHFLEHPGQLFAGQLLQESLAVGARVNDFHVSCC